MGLLANMKPRKVEHLEKQIIQESCTDHNRPFHWVQVQDTVARFAKTHNLPEDDVLVIGSFDIRLVETRPEVLAKINADRQARYDALVAQHQADTKRRRKSRIARLEQELKELKKCN